MGEYDVDDLLEQAFQKVEEVDRNGSKSKKPMEDLIMQEAKKAGISDIKRSESRKRQNNDGGSDDEKSSYRKEHREGRDERKKEERRHRSPSNESRSKKRSRSREHKRRRSRSRSSSIPPKRKRSSRERKRSRSRSLRRRSRSPRRRSRSRSPIRPRMLDHRGSPPWRRSPPRARLPGPERRDVLDSLSMPFSPKFSPPRNAKVDMTPEERDERTIFILQLSRNTRPRDLEEFFSSVGHVRDVRIITDSKTRRSKGIAYVEFWDKDSVPLAMGLNGQKLLNAPLVIQMTCAERNRLANASMGGAIGLGITVTSGSLKICVSNLHAHITDDMLSAIFEPFGKIEHCSVTKDSAGVSKGFGYVKFRHSDEGKKAFEQLNGFELAGKNIRLTTVDEEYNDRQLGTASETQQSLEAEDRMEMNSQGRLQLMAKLAEGSGMQIPQSTRDALAQQQQVQETIPNIATQCFMLSNMFDPLIETDPGWEIDVRDDVIDECNSNGGVVHVYVDKASAQGNVYVKCPSVAVAHRSVVALHGRYFAGKVITANYVPVNSYHDLFPDARAAMVNLTAVRR